MSITNPPAGHGVRNITIEDMAPRCEIFINQPLYKLSDLVKGKKVVDIGCGYGRNRSIVEAAGGEWIGVEPFEGGAHTVVGDAENLPFPDNTFDIAIMDAVLEHIPNVAEAFKEVARVLKPGGLFIGYVAYMECFHEISYSHLSFKALEHFSNINNMKLEKISGGSRFGIDYHKQVLYYPLPFRFFRSFLAWRIRTFFKLKSKLVYLAYRFRKKLNAAEAKRKSNLYFQVECLRQSNGFQYIISKRS
jgi:ubiquinone/menaquinone biosynthesis C-methylase UbiE